jgi:membrane-bound ClpP family serine protease
MSNYAQIHKLEYSFFKALRHSAVLRDQSVISSLVCFIVVIQLLATQLLNGQYQFIVAGLIIVVLKLLASQHLNGNIHSQDQSIVACLIIVVLELLASQHLNGNNHRPYTHHHHHQTHR